MLADYDEDPVAALANALRIVLEQPDSTWPELVARAGLADTQAAALLVGEEGALDALARTLNEVRELA